jgi:tetratricopeptide (TPR) repeat protein
VRTTSLVFVLGSAALWIAPAQTFPTSRLDQGSAILGEVRCGKESLGNVTVELLEKGMRAARTIVASGGGFEFNAVSPGSYSIRVLDRNGGVLAEQEVSVGSPMEYVQVRIPEAKVVRTDGRAPPTVSLFQLQHKAPAKALKEYHAALKAFDKRDYESGASHLGNAIEIDPDFGEAQMELGKWWLQKNELEKSLAAFEKASKCDPRSTTAHIGSGFALLKMRRVVEAEQSARRALEVDRSNPGSSYLLGLSLAAQEKNDEEALQHLQRAAKRIPEARLTIVRIWARQGRLKEARTELQDYLQSGPADAAGAKNLLAQLEERR